MSGGYFNYTNETFADEMFGACDDIKAARKLDPFEDKLLSELAFDFLKLVAILDRYKSGDTGEMFYRIAAKEFKDKWFGESMSKDFMRNFIIDNCNDLKAELLNSFNVLPHLVPLKCTCGNGYPSYHYPYGKCEIYCKKCGKKVQNENLEDTLADWNKVISEEKK